MSSEKLIINYKKQFTNALSKFNELLSISRYSKDVDKKQLRINKRDYKQELNHILFELNEMGIELTDDELRNGFNMEELLNG